MKEKIKNSYRTNKETIHNFIWRSIQTFGKQGITFLIFILCAKLLTPYDFGIYNYVLAIVFFLIIFGDFGISTATSKYVAEYNVTDKNKLKSVLFNSGIIILGLTIIISVLTLIIGPSYLKEKYIYVLWLLPLIFLAPMTSLYDGIYRGLKRFKKLAIISLIVGFFSLSFVYILIKTYGLFGAIIAQNLFYLILFVALALGYREFHFKWNKEVMKEVGSYSFVFGIAVIGYYLFSRIDILILGHYGYINEIATYELINKFIAIILLPFSIFGQIIAPDIASRYALKDKEYIFKSYKKYLIIFLACGILVTLLFLLIFPTGVNLFFNNYYNSSLFKILIPCLLLLALSIFNSPINAGIVVSTGHAKLMTYLNVWMGLANIILALILLNIIGYIGVIYATLISNLIGTIILQTKYYRILKNETK